MTLCGRASVLLLVAVGAVTQAGCERHPQHRKFASASPALSAEGDAGADAHTAPAFQLAEVDLTSRKTARWWTVPDGGPEPSEYYPCTDCHDDEMERNPKVRVLEEDHDDMVFDHGGGRIWCLSCHHLQDREKLASGTGEALAWERPDKACATCHIVQQRDFEHGVHGKRLGGYTEPRTLASCVACHDPHAPVIPPRKPKPPPLASRFDLEARQ